MAYRRKYTLVALMTLAICALALYVHRHREGRTGLIDELFISLTGKLQKHSMYFVRGGRSLLDRYVVLVNTKEENKQLRRETAYLRMKLAALQEVEGENERLRRSLRFSDQFDLDLLAAHVVAHDVSSEYFGVRIDKGKRDGLKPGMGVISPSGLVGRILRVTESYSDVLTLVDPTSNIDAVVQRSRARGIASGLGHKRNCRLKYVDQLEDVSVDDTVVSSGFGNIFPKGLLLGYVTEVDRSASGVLQNIQIKSAVDIYRLEEVFVVLTPAEAEKIS